MQKKYRILIEELKDLADSHKKDGSKFTESKLREAITTIEELLETEENEENDGK